VTFSIVIMIAVAVCIGVINLYAAVTCADGCKCSLSLYACAICVMPSIIIAFIIYLFVEDPFVDAVFVVRMIFLFITVIWACFIVNIVYVNVVTESWFRTSVYVTNNSVNVNTTREDFGYVNCREWFVLPGTVNQ